MSNNRISLKVKVHKKDKTEPTTSELELSILNPSDREKAKKILVKKIPEQYHDQIDSLEKEVLRNSVMFLQPRVSVDKVLKRYHMILCKICTNINKNDYIIDQLSSGNLSLKDLPSMSDTELNPNEWSKQLTIRAVEADQVVHGNTNIATTDQIKCPKRGCGASVRYTEEQTRSADEAATIKAECIECGYKFNI